MVSNSYFAKLHHLLYCQIYQSDSRMRRFFCRVILQISKSVNQSVHFHRNREKRREFIIFMPRENAPRTFCCFSVSVLSSLSWLSSLSSLSFLSSLSSPDVPGLVISSCLGSTSSPPPAGGKQLRCWPGALGCSACGAARLSLHTCLCTNPKETTLTPHSPEGYLEGEEGIVITLILIFDLSYCYSLTSFFQYIAFIVW